MKKQIAKTISMLMLFAGLFVGIVNVSASADRPPLGINLARVDDWSTEFAFLDAFKTSRPWFSGSRTTWQDTRPIDLDEHGWVRSLQPGQIVRTLMFWDLNLAPGRYPAGRYIVQYEGEGTLEYTPNVRRVESTPGREVLEVDPTRSGIGLFITVVNPANYLRNIQVRMPIEAPEGEVFNPVFLDRIKNYRVIRFMDWMATTGDWTATGGSRQQHWADRPKLEDARWSNTHGVPVEIMVALANRIGADAWFCMPHLADDDYVRRFAEAVHTSLDPKRTVYLEYSNEVWNSQFAQAHYAQQQGLALGLSQNPYEAQIRYHSRRSREIFAIWEGVFPKEHLVRVLSSLAADAWTSETALTYGDTLAHTDALAIAPYFGISPQDQARVQAMSLDALMAELESHSLPQAQSWMRQQAAVAARHSVQLIAYEAGQHLRGEGTFQTDPALNALFDAANRDPRMGALYTRYLQDWFEAGGQLMNHYHNCGAYSRYGRFGSLEYLDQPRAEAPKYDALQRYLEERAAEDDLKSLSDDFDDPQTLSAFRHVYQDEQWPANQLERFELSSGWMTMMPYASTWYRDYRGALAYKAVQGDFVVTTRVRVSGRSGASAPLQPFSLAGIMLRAPRNVTPQTWQPGGENYVFLSLGAASSPGRYQFEVKTTTNSNSQLEITEANTSEVIIQSARIGPYLILLHKTPAGPWVVHRRYFRSDLPNQLQVGLTSYTDWPSCSRLTPFEHNSRIVTEGHPDLVAQFDYVYYRRPNVPAHLVGKVLSDPQAVSDADVLSFLGEHAASKLDLVPSRSATQGMR